MSSRRRLSEAERAQAMADRDELIRVRQQTYEQFKDAVVLISSLPRAEDMVLIVKGYDRSQFVRRRISKLARWMKDFDDAWNANGHDEAKRSP